MIKKQLIKKITDEYAIYEGDSYELMKGIQIIALLFFCIPLKDFINFQILDR